MNLEIWPYRVGMRHFRAPRRQEPGWEEQSGRAGGHIYQQQAGQHGGRDQGFGGARPRTAYGGYGAQTGQGRNPRSPSFVLDVHCA